jgi:hypothetical protein
MCAQRLANACPGRHVFLTDLRAAVAAAPPYPCCYWCCSATPIFFILFPGYSPSKEIEVYANKLGKTVESGKLTLISMGQGQEGPAEAVLDRWGWEDDEGGCSMCCKAELHQVCPEFTDVA